MLTGTKQTQDNLKKTPTTKHLRYCCRQTSNILTTVWTVSEYFIGLAIKKNVTLMWEHAKSRNICTFQEADPGIIQASKSSSKWLWKWSIHKSEAIYINASCQI